MVKIVAALLVLGLLIFVHELGHFLVAKAVKIRVHEFSIGFGPKIVGFKKGDTDYNWRVLPFGGYVQMAGMDSSDEEDYNDERSFAKKSVLQRMAVISAGPLMNFFLAIVLFAIIFTFHGMNTATSTEIGAVSEGNPAAEAGLQGGDLITSINGQQVSEWTSMVDIINSNPNTKLLFGINRSGEEFSVSITPYEDETGRGLIGIEAASTKLVKMNPFQAIWEGFSYTIEFSGMILVYLGKMLTNQAAIDLGGPVLIVSEVGKAAEFGIYSIMQLAAALSINLGLFNLIPIPALDGSKLIFLSIEGIKGSPVSPNKENFVNFLGFAFLMFLMIVVTYNDIIDLL